VTCEDVEAMSVQVEGVGAVVEVVDYDIDPGGGVVRGLAARA